MNEDIELHARHSDPLTSHEAMVAYDRERMQCAVDCVIDIYRTCRELADYQLKVIFDAEFKQQCSAHLYQQARSVARDKGFIRDSGRKTINPQSNRRQVIWEYCDVPVPVIVQTCPTCGGVWRRKEKEIVTVQKIISSGLEGVESSVFAVAELLGLATDVIWEPGASGIEKRVRVSEATVIISDSEKLVDECYATMCVCESLERPVWRVIAGSDGVGGWLFEEWMASGSNFGPDMDRAFDMWLRLHSVRTLNIAGPRASKWTDGEEAAAAWVCGKFGVSE